MSHKTEAAYNNVLDFIKVNIGAITCAKFTTDYEIAMRNALRQHSPDAEAIVCWFHFTQAVKRYASKIAGFVIFLRSEETGNAMNIFRKFLCLPLLPEANISSIFELLKEEAFTINKEKFFEFISYFNRQWILKVSNAYKSKYKYIKYKYSNFSGGTVENNGVWARNSHNRFA